MFMYLKLFGYAMDRCELSGDTREINAGDTLTLSGSMLNAGELAIPNGSYAIISLEPRYPTAVFATLQRM